MSRIPHIFILGVLYIFIIPVTAFSQERIRATEDTAAIAQEQFIVDVLERDPRVLAALKSYEATRERANQAKALEDPQLTVGAFISPIETRVGPQQARIGIRQMFPWFGTLSVRQQQALTEVRRAWYNYLEVRAEVVLETYQNFARMYELEEEVYLLQEQQKVMQSLERIAMVRYEGGEGSLADVLRVQLQLAELETGIDKKKADRLLALLIFNARLPDRYTFRPGENLPDTLTLIPTDSLFDMDKDVQGQFRLLGAQEEIEAARKGQEAARLAGRPMLGAGVDYVITGKRDDMNVPDNGRDAIMPMVTVSLPVFRKKYKSLNREAALMAEVAEARYEGLFDKVNREAIELTMTLFGTGKDIELLQKQIYLAEKTQKLLIGSYSSGDESLQNVLDVQQQIIDYRMKLLQAVTRQYINSKKVNYLTGTEGTALKTKQNEESTE